MTSDDRTEKLEQRVDRLEDQYREDIVSIHAKIDSLISTINTGMVRAAKAECPAPGTCLTLGTLLTAATARVERLEIRMLAMDSWRMWVTGIGVTLLTLGTIFGPAIRRAFHLE